tara:strand:- start:3621 stop:5249 length:1629 start_codon:yes stop_codon:yes gene_type:complete
MKLNQDSINQIIQFMKMGQLEKALQLTNNLLRLNKDNLQLNKLASIIYGDKNDISRSIEILLSMKKIHPEDFEIANNLGYYYLSLEKLDMAFNNINDAIKIKPEDPTPYRNLAEYYLLLRDFEKAEIFITQCLEKNERKDTNFSQYIPAILMKSQILIAKKEKNGAVKFLMSYLNKIFDPELAFELVKINKDEISKNMILQSEQLIKNSLYKSHIDKFNKLSPLLFFLAKYYENSNNQLSENYYIQANQEIASIQRLRVIIFQKQFLTVINNYKNNYQKIKDYNFSKQNNSQENIFVVGMPRSGTSLLESIISANNQVFPGGELKAIGYLCKTLKDETLVDLEDLINTLGDEYIKTSYFIKNSCKFLVDKMPENFVYIGFILAALPKSKIILLLRNPWDIAVSIYKQRYTKNITYASSFFNIAVYIANFEAMTTFWKSFPEIDNNILTLKYEDLVNDFSNQQHSIYKFCRINEEYSEDLRKGHFVRTASMSQIQKPIQMKAELSRPFESFKSEFMETYQAQREFWIDKGINFSGKFFGYLKN